MDIKKFNNRMARPKYSKGGYIKKLGNRKYFDVGGIASNVTPTSLGGPGNPTNTNGTGIGGISNALGLNAQSANIQQGTNTAQLNNAYTGANNALNAQVGIANTVNPQVQTAVNNQNTVAGQELAMTQGAGPNPAANQLAQATGTNVSNQAALMAGQRGSGANPALIAREAAQQGASTQQQAAGQAATLEAQQQIAAQQNLAALSGQQVGQAQGATSALNQGQQNEQNILQNANTAANNSAVGMQSNINNVNSANNQAVLGGISSGISSLAGGLFAEGGQVTHHGKHKLEFIHKMAKMGLDHFDKGGPVPAPSPSDSGIHFGAPSAQASDKPPIDPVKAQSAQDSMRGAFGYADGGTISANPLVSAITTPPTAMPQTGGYNQVQTAGGPNVDNSQLAHTDIGQKAKEGFASGQAFKKAHPMMGSSNAISDASGVSGGAMSAGDSLGGDLAFAANGGEIWNLPSHKHAEYSANHFSQYFSKGGESKKVDAMVSANERYLNPEEVEMVKHGADPKKLGYKFPGKDKVPGRNSLKNDTIPATLEEGGVVIPLSVEKTKNSDKMRLFTLKSLKATGKHMKKPMGMK